MPEASSKQRVASSEKLDARGSGEWNAAADLFKCGQEFVDDARRPVRARIDPAGFAEELMAVDARHEELSDADLARDGDVRHDANAKAGLHHRLDDLHVLGFHDDVRLDVLAEKEAIDDASGSRARFEQHERLARQVLRADLLPL